MSDRYFFASLVVTLQILIYLFLADLTTLSVAHIYIMSNARMSNEV